MGGITHCYEVVIFPLARYDIFNSLVIKTETKQVISYFLYKLRKLYRFQQHKYLFIKCSKRQNQDISHERISNVASFQLFQHSVFRLPRCPLNQLHVVISCNYGYQYHWFFAHWPWRTQATVTSSIVLVFNVKQYLFDGKYN